MNNAASTRLKVSDSVMTDYSLTSGIAVWSDGINVSRNGGFANLLVKEDKAGGAGDVDISAEYSLDNTNWYTAYVSNMSGTITAEGNIVTNLQNVTRFIVFTPRLTNFIRFKFDPDADSQVTADFTYQDRA